MTLYLVWNNSLRILRATPLPREKVPDALKLQLNRRPRLPQEEVRHRKHPPGKEPASVEFKAEMSRRTKDKAIGRPSTKDQAIKDKVTTKINKKSR